MGRFGIIRDHEHRKRVQRKYDDIATWKALKAEWELAGLHPDDPIIQGYDRRIKVLENQLKNMRP